MKAPAFVLGYHGCDRLVAERVFAGEIGLKPSENEHDWLGTGIYFWENSPTRALEWARAAKATPALTKQPIETPAVIGAIIDLGNCLDLLEAESIEIVRNGYEALAALSGVADVPLPHNKVVRGEPLLRYLDCAVVNLIHNLRGETEHPFDSVRAMFGEGKPIYKGAAFRERTHIQVCVRKAENIVGYFRPQRATL